MRELFLNVDFSSVTTIVLAELDHLGGHKTSLKYEIQLSITQFTVTSFSPVLNVEQLTHLTGSNIQSVDVSATSKTNSRLQRIIRPSQTRYTSSVRLRFIRRTNDGTNYCRTVDELIRCDNCSPFKTGVKSLNLHLLFNILKAASSTLPCCRS